MFSSSEYSNSIGIGSLVVDRATTKWKYSNVELAPNCPRCASSNTKFCYYNNYSLSQPRYFCKGCRRYWTKGGSLRNVQVGGGCRKSRRARSSRQGGGATYTSPGSLSIDKSDQNSSFIDMAAVFAKYVNSNVENEECSSGPGGSSGSSSDNNIQASSLDIDSHQMEDITMFEYQKPMDLINGGDDHIQQGLPQFSICPDIIGQDFVYQHAFEGMLGDEVQTAETLWSESTTFGSQQPMVEVQDFRPYSPDHNQLTDNWGSFDLSAYEFFLTP